MDWRRRWHSVGNLSGISLLTTSFKSLVCTSRTYPLPEAQLDRFLFMITVDYPSSAEELEIMKRGTTAGGGNPEAVLTAEEIVDLYNAVKRIPIADHIYEYAEKLVRSTRPKDPSALDFCKKWLN